MSVNRYNPDPLFYTVGFEPRVIKATEKQLAKMYKAGYLGFCKDEQVAIYCNMMVEEYRALCAADPLAAIAAERGRVASEARTAERLDDLVEEGDVKAILGKLKHKHNWMEAKATNETDNTLVIKVVNAEPESSKD